MIETTNTRKIGRIILVTHERIYDWNYALIYSKYLNLTTWIKKRSQKALLQIYATVTLRPLLEIVTTIWTVNAFFGRFFVAWFIASLVLQGSHTQCQFQRPSLLIPYSLIISELIHYFIDSGPFYDCKCQHLWKNLIFTKLTSRPK